MCVVLPHSSSGMKECEKGWVGGVLFGPPCETWSQARFHQLKGTTKRGPRPLRDLLHLWGLDSLSLREAAHVDVGNELLLFSLIMMYDLALAQGFGVLEHPKE